MIKFLSPLLLFILIYESISAQSPDSLLIRNIYNEALSRGHAYQNLRELCKDVGARLSGSAEAQMAIEWSKRKMSGYGFDTVYLQPIKVPHWERGNKEAGWVRLVNGDLRKVHLLALGGSVGTNGMLEGNVLEFSHIDELKNADSAMVSGKIVFLNQPMNEQDINTFKAYGGCYAIRGNGAVEAAKLGAKAVIIRSLGLPVDEHPHTGSMHYEDGIPRIPAAAISTQDAEWLSAALKKNACTFVMEMDCRNFPDADSYNVIAELRGRKKSNEIITFGGHLDSWDAGEGAHDDGAGVIHCLEALRILKKLNYRPNHTLRVVFFMNEENGNRGGIAYAEWCKSKGEKHIAALESDRGGFSPRGFSCDGSSEQIAQLQRLAPVLKPYELYEFDKGYGGVDIGPLKNTFPGIPLFGFVPDSQRYFDFHHAPSDVFENVNKRELELGAAAIAAMVYMLDIVL
jgi:carboxypeptidase Q